MSLSAAGLNLHKACSRGMILQYSWDWNSDVQTTGRISRLGQTEPVTWIHVHVRRTYYDVALHKMNLKFVEQLILESRIPGHIKHPVLQRVIGHEILRTMVALPFNTYCWVLDPPGHVDEFFGSRASRIGKFLSLISTLLADTTPESMAKLEKLGNELGRLAAFIVDNQISLDDITIDYLSELVDKLLKDEKKEQSKGKSAEAATPKKPLVPIRGLASVLYRSKMPKEFVDEKDDGSDDEASFVWGERCRLFAGQTAGFSSLLDKNDATLSKQFNLGDQVSFCNGPYKVLY